MFEYEVTINLNEDGQKVTGKDKKVVYVKIDKDLDNVKFSDELADAIQHEFPAINLIDGYTYKKTLYHLKIGDIVDLHNPNDNNVVTAEITDIRNIRSKTVFDVEAIPINGYDDPCMNHHLYDTTGAEAMPGKRNAWHLTEASEEHKESYAVLKNYNTMLEDICERAQLIPDDYQEEKKEGIKYINELSTDQLKRILDIFNE